MRTLTLKYLIGLLLLVHSGIYARDRQPVAQGGVLDLREYNFKSEGPLELKGEFEFYWNQMLTASLNGDSGIASMIRVPGSWYRLRKTNPEIKRHGFATYRLMILLPPGVDELSFSVGNVHSASGFFLNGKAIDYLGFPGLNKYQTLIRYSRPLLGGRVQGSEVELLIKVSNFDHRLSGITGTITMGLPQQMREQRQHELFRGHFLIGAFLIIGIYFLGLFLIRSERYRLYFAVICFLMAARVAMITEIPALDSIVMNGLTAARIDFLNIYFFAPFFTLMIRSIFPFEFPSWAFKAGMWVSAFFIVLVVLAPISLFSYTLSWFFVFFILLSILYMHVVAQAWSRGRSHAPAFTMGMLILFFGTLNDMLVEVDVLHGPYIVHYTMFGYLLIYAYIFADKSNLLQTKSEKLAQELNQVRNNLEDLVEERTTELQSVSRQLENQKRKLEISNRELVEAMNARNRLFSIIGHDVRAPIGYMRQALDMLIDSKDINDEERDELLRIMATSAGGTYNLLDNLLLWGRSQTGRLKASPVSFQLRELFEESMDLVKIGINEKKLKVEVYISEEHFVEADRDQLFVVIRNLLSNAMKFTPEKGSIYISSKKQKGEVVLSIRDTGIGIPEANLAKLLDSRSHLSTNGTRGEKGSGLGLKICHDIIQSNEGWMKVESAPGTGTTIFIGIKAARKSA
jgi:signal transduction histidine kinase